VYISNFLNLDKQAILKDDKINKLKVKDPAKENLLFFY